MVFLIIDFKSAKMSINDLFCPTCFQDWIVIRCLIIV